MLKALKKTATFIHLAFVFGMITSCIGETMGGGEEYIFTWYKALNVFSTIIIAALYGYISGKANNQN